MNASRKRNEEALRANFFGAAAVGLVELPVTTFERIELPERDLGPCRVEHAVIVDYGLGNLRSVANALGRLGVTATISTDPAVLCDATALILPGVGAFGRAMDNLRAARLVDVLGEAVLERKRPTLGICLGMQILAESSNELGLHRGLGWIPGQVERLGGPTGLPVPHVGWNQVTTQQNSVLFQGIPPAASFYFDHSFAMRACPSAVSSCDYDGAFVAAVEHGNLMAVQFHPEKSQLAGQRLLANFLAFAARQNAG